MRIIYYLSRGRVAIKISVCAFLALTMWVFVQHAQSAALEYQVKASYLYNFLQFIAWPKDAFIGDGKFNLCVLGAERFGPTLDGFAGERVEGREIAVHRLQRAAQVQALRCHLLFISAGASDIVPADVGGEYGLLVIGETPGFLAQGGTINLVEMRGRIRFEINQQTANKAGLVVSSRILSLAVNKP